MKFRCQCRPWLYYRRSLFRTSLARPDGCPASLTTRITNPEAVRKSLKSPKSNLAVARSLAARWSQSLPLFRQLSNVQHNFDKFWSKSLLVWEICSCHHSVMWSRTLIGSRRTPTTDLVTTKITPTPLSLASSQGSNTKNIRFKRWCKEHLFTTKPFQRSFWGVEKHLLLFRVQLSIYLSNLNSVSYCHWTVK